jgi:hypothetical protein
MLGLSRMWTAKKCGVQKSSYRRLHRARSDICHAKIFDVDHFMRLSHMRNNSLPDC